MQYHLDGPAVSIPGHSKTYEEEQNGEATATVALPAATTIVPTLSHHHSPTLGSTDCTHQQSSGRPVGQQQQAVSKAAAMGLQSGFYYPNQYMVSAPAI